jgi:hypothetical protein
MKLDEQLFRLLIDNVLSNCCSLQDYSANLRKLIRKFRDNKISLKLLASTNLPFKENIEPYIVEDEQQQKEWIETFALVSRLLRQKGIIHVFIKIFRHPWAIMSDVDILPLNPTEELKALEVLHDAGFHFFQVRILVHPLRVLPLKICARKFNASLFVDFYPKPVWTRKIVHENEIIISRRQISEVHGIEAYVPSPEDDLYLVATHAYNDFKIPLASILHGLKVISYKFDWEYLFNLAQSYGTLDAVYVYLRALEVYSAGYLGESIISKDILERYERYKICRSIKKWFEKTYEKRLDFPITIPIKLGSIYSSFYHCGTLLGCVSLSELLYDFLSHYYTPLALLLNELRKESKD